MRVPFFGKMPHGGFRKYGGIPGWGQEQDKSRRRIFVYKGKTYKVHRLVCEAFHGPAPFTRAVVMHINEDVSDNRAKNLKWGSQKENLNAPGFLDYCRRRTGDKSTHAIHKRTLQ